MNAVLKSSSDIIMNVTDRNMGMDLEYEVSVSLLTKIYYCLLCKQSIMKSSQVPRKKDYQYSSRAQRRKSSNL